MCLYNERSSQLTHWEESKANAMPYYFRELTGNVLTYASLNSYLRQGSNSYIEMLLSYIFKLAILQRCYYYYYCPHLVRYQVKIAHHVSKL